MTHSEIYWDSAGDVLEVEREDDGSAALGITFDGGWAMLYVPPADVPEVRRRLMEALS